MELFNASNPASPAVAVRAVIALSDLRRPAPIFDLAAVHTLFNLLLTADNASALLSPAASETIPSAAAALSTPSDVSLAALAIPFNAVPNSPPVTKPAAPAPRAKPMLLTILSNKKFAVNRLDGSHQLPFLSRSVL